MVCTPVQLNAMLSYDVITALHSGSFQKTPWLQEMSQFLKELVSNGRFHINYSIYKLQTYHVKRIHMRNFIKSFLMREFN